MTHMSISTWIMVFIQNLWTLSINAWREFKCLASVERYIFIVRNDRLFTVHSLTRFSFIVHYSLNTHLSSYTVHGVIPCFSLYISLNYLSFTVYYPLYTKLFFSQFCGEPPWPRSSEPGTMRFTSNSDYIFMNWHNCRYLVHTSQQT